jgi:hypothetical protein
MIGLALMARDLAEKRNDDTKLNAGGEGRVPVSRELAKDCCYTTSREYYAIIDRIARGQKP